jgi:hypothetical protein
MDSITKTKSDQLEFISMLKEQHGLTFASETVPAGKAYRAQQKHEKGKRKDRITFSITPAAKDTQSASIRIGILASDLEQMGIKEGAKADVAIGSNGMMLIVFHEKAGLSVNFNHGHKDPLRATINLSERAGWNLKKPPRPDNPSKPSWKFFPCTNVNMMWEAQSISCVLPQEYAPVKEPADA